MDLKTRELNERMSIEKVKSQTLCEFSMIFFASNFSAVMWYLTQHNITHNAIIKFFAATLSALFCDIDSNCGWLISSISRAWDFSRNFEFYLVHIIYRARTCHDRSAKPTITVHRICVFTRAGTRAQSNLWGVKYCCWTNIYCIIYGSLTYRLMQGMGPLNLRISCSSRCVNLCARCWFNWTSMREFSCQSK